jgi:hypothetical protein
MPIPDNDEAMSRAYGSSHPDPATLRQFAVGRLQGEAMRRVELHVRDCKACVKAALDAPDDRLVGLLRRTAPKACVEARGPDWPNFGVVRPGPISKSRLIPSEEEQESP